MGYRLRREGRREGRIEEGRRRECEYDVQIMEAGKEEVRDREGDGREGSANMGCSL